MVVVFAGTGDGVEFEHAFGHQRDGDAVVVAHESGDGQVDSQAAGSLAGQQS